MAMQRGSFDPAPEDQNIVLIDAATANDDGPNAKYDVPMVPE
jgi:hypothetical protein